MSELLKEFEDDLKRERAETRWRSFGKNMVAVSVAVVIGTIGAVVWQNVKSSRATEETALFIRGVDRQAVEDYKGAVEVFDELAKQGSNNKYGLAMLRKAQSLEALGDKTGAQAVYKELAEHDDSDNEAFAGLARILAAEGSDELIEPDKDSPYYHAQMEWKAWQLVEQDKKDEAVKIFLALQDDTNTPTTIHGRAAEAVQLLDPGKLLEKVEAPADE